VAKVRREKLATINFDAEIFSAQNENKFKEEFFRTMLLRRVLL